MNDLEVLEFSVAAATEPESAAPASPVARPDFMPPALWFTYLLRSDVRLGRSVGDAEAMRDFCCWWLMAGHVEYPGVWGVTSRIVSVAMETIKTDSGPMPRLLWFLWKIRPDLQQAFTLWGSENVFEYFCWYRLVAHGQFGYAPELPPDLIRQTEQASRHVPGEPVVSRMALVMLSMAPALAKTLDLRLAEARARLIGLYRENAARLLGAPRPIPAPPLAPRPMLTQFPQGAMGINLVGFARSEFGLGEDVRMLSSVLEAAGIEHVVVDVAAESGSVARREDATLAARIVDRPVHPITILCMSPFDAATLWLRRGREIFDDRYVIGYWAWELERLPDPWHEVALLADELWAPSRYTEQALRAQPFRKVRYLPPLVEIPKFRRLSRRALGLPAKKYLFLYPFDPNSFLARKNPSAAVRAFRLGFPEGAAGSGDVRLVLRVNGKTGGPGWEDVTEAIGGDARIIIIDGTMDRARALALMAACDCLVSPHRAEGFGRNIAEAKLLGLRVIATGYSGCVDFLEPEECVRFSMVPVGDGYPFGDGLCWAEPDIEDVAERMRRVFAER